MKRKTSHKRIILSVVALLLLTAIGYDALVGPPVSSAQNLVNSSADTTTSTAGIGQELTDLMNQVQAISIDTAVLKDSSYLSLRDYAVTLIPVETGRPNPFAPLPSSAPATKIIPPKGR